MNSKDTMKNRAHTSPKPGRNLLCEILIFVFVYAIGYLANLLVTAVALEGIYIPNFGNPLDFALLADPNSIVTQMMSLPYIPVIMLFSTAGTVLVVILFCRIIQKRSWSSIGLSRKGAFSHYFWGFAGGFLAISLAVAASVVVKSGYFGDGDKAPALLIALFLLGYLIQGASEEILCRGYFMNSVARRYPMWVAVVTSSVLFAWLHLPNNGVSAFAFVNLFLFGVLAALITIRTGSIWYASGFHSAWNFFQGNFYGIKVSGMDMHGSLFRYVSAPGKAWLDGGDFGVEGGLLCTVIMVAGILFTLSSIRKNTQTSHGEHQL